MPGKTVSQSRQHNKKRKTAPKEIPGAFLLHLPPWILIIAAGVVSGLLGAWVFRTSSDVMEIALRLAWPARLVSITGAFLALTSGFYLPGARPIRAFGFSVVFLSLGSLLAIFLLGEATPPLVINLSLVSLFASLPLHLRKVNLTEAWIHGSLKPVFYCLLAAISFLPSLFLVWGYDSFWHYRANTIVREAEELTEGLRRLSSQGGLSEEETEKLQELAKDLPSARSLWLAIAATLPEETGNNKARTRVEETFEDLLSAVQDLFLANRAPIAAQGPWDDKNSPTSNSNQKHYGKVRSYWEQVQTIVADGELLSPFIKEAGEPYGLAPNSKARPEPGDIVAKITLFRGQMNVRMEGLQGAIVALDGDAARLAEALAARKALAPYPSLAAPLNNGLTASLEKNSIDSWSLLRLAGIELFDFWNLLSIQDPNRLLAEQVRCFSDQPKNSKTKSRVYSCPSYDLSAKDPLEGLVVRTLLIYERAKTSQAKILRIEIPKPKNLPNWKSDVLDTLKRRGITVSKRSDGTGYNLAPPEGNTDQSTLFLKFTETRKRAGLQISRTS